MSAPLWLLDVDGVLNAVRLDVPEGHVRCEVGDSDARTWDITYRPAVVEFIRDLHESGRVEVRWLTTWCEDARDSLAPAVGLPLDCAVEGVAERSRFRPSDWWKSTVAQRLSDADPDRPLIWTDDDLDYGLRTGEAAWLRSRSGRTLGISPKCDVGLTDDHLAAITAFVEEAS